MDPLWIHFPSREQLGVNSPINGANEGTVALQGAIVGTIPLEESQQGYSCRPEEHLQRQRDCLLSITVMATTQKTSKLSTISSKN